MNWYNGSIAEAVKITKEKSAIFVVFAEGKSPINDPITSALNSKGISDELRGDSYVCIKLAYESAEYYQFAAIYTLVPLPSIFFIGLNGTPIEIITDASISADELLQKIIRIKDGTGGGGAGTTNTSSSLIMNNNEPSTSRSASSNTNTESSSKARDTERQPTIEDVDEDNDDDALKTERKQREQREKEEKLQRAKQLIVETRERKKAEDAEKEKERELQRRRIGQDLQAFKHRQQEIELKELKEERKRDKIAEQTARKRILDQIAADRLERSGKFIANEQAHSTLTDENEPPSNQHQKSMNEIVRIQFKKPNGEAINNTFNHSDTFEIIREYVITNIFMGGTNGSQFSLATTYPRYEFTIEDNAKTLLELQLAPSAVILILPMGKPSSPASKIVSNSALGTISYLAYIFSYITSPIYYIYEYIRGYFAPNAGPPGARNMEGRKRTNENTNEETPNEAAKRRNIQLMARNRSNADEQRRGNIDGEQKYSRKTGNVHRLREPQDSDDENNTWNGNSTQQQ